MFIHFVDNFIYGFGLVKTSNNIIKKLKHFFNISNQPQN